MSRGRKFLLYGLTAAAALLISLYVRFPGEAVRDYLTALAAAGQPQLRLSIAEVRPAFPLGLAFSDLTVAGRQSEGVFRLEGLRVKLSLLSLFRGRLGLVAEAEGYGGRLSGGVDFERLNPRKGPFSAKADLRGVRLEKAAILQSLLSRPLSGTLGARVSFSGPGGDLKAATGNFDFTVTNGTYPLAEKFLGLDRIEFGRVEGQAGLRNGTLKITRLSLTGEKIRCFLKGDIVLAEDLAASRLDLSGTLDLPGQGNKRFTLTITGTVGSPQSRLM